MAAWTGGGREAGSGDDGDAVRLGQDLLDDEPAGDQREEALGHSEVKAGERFPLCARRPPLGLLPSRSLRENQNSTSSYSKERPALDGTLITIAANGAPCALATTILERGGDGSWLRAGLARLEPTRRGPSRRLRS